MFLEFLEHHFLHLHMYRKFTGSEYFWPCYDKKIEPGSDYEFDRG